MEDMTLILIRRLFQLGYDLKKDVIITDTLITIGEFKFNYSCYSLTYGIIEALNSAHAYYKKEIYKNDPYFNRID